MNDMKSVSMNKCIVYLNVVSPAVNGSDQSLIELKGIL